jgi:pilus assembly protein CpaC
MKMKWTIVILVVFGVISAIATTILVNVLRHNTSGDLSSEIEVLVASRSIPAMSIITSSHINKNKIARKFLPEGYLTDPSQAIGRVLSKPIVENQVLTKYCFITDSGGAQLASSLPQGMRAVSVPVSSHSVMGGLLYPGCIVDVLATFPLTYTEHETGQAISTTLLQGIQVLAVQDVSVVSKPEPEKGALDTRKGTSYGALTVTLMVNSKQAEALQLASENGHIMLAMRNPFDKQSIDPAATVLSEGQLAKLGSNLPATVLSGKNGYDPNLITKGANKPETYGKLAPYQQILQEMFPFSPLELNQSGDVLIIKGLLRNANQTVNLHEYFDKAGIKYVDMTSVAGVQQVQLDVRVAEVSRTAIRALGVNTFFSDGGSFWGVQPGSSSGGAVVSGLGLNAATPSSVSVFGGFHVNGSDFRTFIQALAENQYLRVLANPTLVALSGEEASFLAGGEFPIPVVQTGTGGESSGTSISIEYKEYGVRLTFRPTVLGDGTIRLYAAPEVSDLTTVGAVTISGFEVPALRTRKFETTLELKSGQTFAMAGLIKRNDDAINSRVPGLGDLPVLGALFRSVRYARGETEMVVLVTASLVEPLNLAAVPPLPGFLDEQPNDWELYLEGRIGGKAPAKVSPTDMKWLRQMGLDKLSGPGAWDSYENSTVPSQVDFKKP